MTTLLRNVRPWGAAPQDLVLDEDAILAAGDPGSLAADATAEVVEGEDRVVVPTLADVHLHLDSNRLGLPFRPQTGEPGRMGRILNDRAHWRSAERSVADRATYALRRMIELGATKVRSHAQVDADSGLEKWEGVLAAREAMREYADVELVVFPQVGIHLEPGVVPLIEYALRMGGDLVGGIDPCEIDRDPARHLDTVFELAEKHQKRVDIHLHERGSLGLWDLDMIAERTRALGMQGRVTVSHAFCLSEDTAPVRAAIETLAELDIALTTIAPAHGLPIRGLVEAGVRVGLGMDGQRDYWSPYGNADMLDRTWQLAFTQGFGRDEELELALQIATWGGRSVIDAGHDRVAGGARPGVGVGAASDLLLLGVESAASAVIDRPEDRVVIRRGRVIARGGTLLS